MKYIFVLCFVLLTACGVKPSHLDAPQEDGVTPTPFPQTYPAP